MQILVLILSIFITIVLFTLWKLYENKIFNNPEKVLDSIEIYLNEKLYYQAAIDLKKALKLNPVHIGLKNKLREIER